ncbi:MAG: hypothetical protein ACKVX7_15420 [Planctomycetota bacterium]
MSKHRETAAARRTRSTPILRALCCAGVFACSLTHAQSSPPPTTPRRVPAFTPETGGWVASAPPWTVWVTSELIEATRLHRAQSHVVRYYRQRWGADFAELVYEMRGTYAKKVITVTEDGTVLLSYGTALTWAAPDQPLREHEPLVIHDVPAAVITGWPDGLVIQPYLLNEPAPLYFVPLKERQLQLAASHRLTDGKSLRVLSVIPVLRAGQHFAWFAEENSASLQIFDVGDTRRQAVTLAAPNPRVERNRLLAFGADFVRTDNGIFDVRDGRLIRSDLPTSRWQHLHGGVLYYLESIGRLATDGSTTSTHSLRAVRLDSPTATPVELLSFLDYEYPHIFGAGPRAATHMPGHVHEHGIALWDGYKWVTVAWRKCGEL